MPLPLLTLHEQMIACRACARLVEWRETVARDRRAAYRNEEYWGKPIVGFGDPLARILVLGLAPGAHGGNRTGRVFTGDRSGDWLYGSLHRAGLANQPHATGRDDGLQLTDVYVSVCVRCVPPGNQPTPQERQTCLPFLEQELALLPNIRVIVCLGSFAWDSAIRLLKSRYPVAKKPTFAHLAEAIVGPFRLVGSYHPSQQNTFTGKLTEAMQDAVWDRVKLLSSASFA
ncbi:uracil-DNA glycosylase [Tuwongella immobilis]|nr:uracil-DNA glycosylase [Tuwongella immobilis]